MENSNESRPPRWPIWLLRFFLKASYLEEIEGNLEERFHDNLLAYRKRRAKFEYVRDALLHIRPALMRNWAGQKKLNHISVFSLYIKSAFRILLKNRAYSIINLLGLSVGMGVCLVIFQYTYLELSYDQFHTDHDQIYRVIIEETNGAGHESYPNGIGYGFAPAAMDEIPEITGYLRKERVNRVATVTNPDNKRVFYEEVNDLLFADAGFFELFNFPLLRGNEKSVFNDSYSIVITEKTATKYFGDEDPIGKRLVISGPPSPGEYLVTGVLEDIPLNTHWQFDFLIPIKNYIEYGWGGAVKRNDDWNGFNVINYLKIEATADKLAVINKLNAMIAARRTEEDTRKQVSLQPLKDIYLESGHLSYQGHFDSTGSIRDILIFGIISGFVLLIAWVNYINLSVTQSIQRTKEVGIRKTLGAIRHQLMAQFISESLLLNTLAGALAIGLAFLILPLLSNFLDKPLEMSLVRLPEFWAVFLAFIVLGAIVSGIYPAFLLSGHQPIVSLKPQANSPRTSVFRKGLMVFQFLISFLLITATYLVYEQVSFLKTRELNVDMEKILVIKGPRVVPDKKKGLENFKVFRTEMARHANIEAVTGSLFTPGDFWTRPYRQPGVPGNEAAYSRTFYTTLNFAETYDLEFVAGGPFTREMPDEKVVIINEAAVAAFGFESAEQSINQKLAGKSGGRNERIVGVVKNFHWHSLREAHEPYVIGLYENNLTEHVSIRLNTSDLSNTLTDLRDSFEKFFPGNPFDYYFADSAFNKQYQSEQKFSQLFLFFSILAIFIGCIGLFALVSYNANLRVKEIGIRKVLGAHVSVILVLLSKQYLRLFAVSILLGAPVAWLAGNRWLNHYDTRIPLSLPVFLVPSIVMLLIATLTIAQRTIRTARANPVNALRNE